MPMLYEIEGKQLFKENKIPTPQFKAYTDSSSIKQFAEEIGSDVMMAKAQALTGKRGKAGLIRKVSSAEAEEYIQSILGREHGGKPVEIVMLEEPLLIEKEYYLAVIWIVSRFVYIRFDQSSYHGPIFISLSFFGFN